MAGCGRTRGGPWGASAGCWRPRWPRSAWPPARPPTGRGRRRSRPRPPPPPGPTGSATGRWPGTAGRLDADPRRLVVSFTGADPAADPADPCWEGYAPEVSAEPDRVVVTHPRPTAPGPPSAPSSPAPTWGSSAPWPCPCTTPWPAGRCSTATRPPAPAGPGPAGAALAARTAGGWSRSSGQTGPGGRDAWERSYGPGPGVGGTRRRGRRLPGDGDRRAGGGRPGRAWLAGRPGGGPPGRPGRHRRRRALRRRPGHGRPLARGPARPGRRRHLPDRPVRTGTWPPSRTCSSGSPRASARRVRGAGARWSRPGCR